MSPEDYRCLALALPEAKEGAHMNHPDFRVRGKIFATLWPAENIGVLKLTLAQQKLLTEREPAIFAPVPGGWGRRGATTVDLKHAKEAAVRSALLAAWRNIAPKALRAAITFPKSNI
jgi:hypothetical protein